MSTIIGIEQSGAVEYTRSLDFFNPHDNSHAAVTLVGCGGIGSFAAHALAKLGIPKITLVDFDHVEAHNVPNQLYEMVDVGDEKVFCLANALEKSTHAEVNPFVGRVTEDGIVSEDGDSLPLSGVVISALDSMHARQLLWEQVRMRFPVNLFLDGRIGGQNIVVYAVNPVDLGDVAGYEATLHSDEEGLDQPCTGRNVIDVGYSMAALLTRHVRKFYGGEDLPKMVYQDQDSLSLTSMGEWLL